MPEAKRKQPSHSALSILSVSLFPHITTPLATANPRKNDAQRRRLDDAEKRYAAPRIIGDPTSWPTAPSPSRRACRGTFRRSSCPRVRRARPGCCRWSPCGAGSGLAAPWTRPTRRSAACRSAMTTGRRRLRRPVRSTRQRGSAGPRGRGPPGSLSDSGLERVVCGVLVSSVLETNAGGWSSPSSVLWGRNPGKWTMRGFGGRRTGHGVWIS